MIIKKKWKILKRGGRIKLLSMVKCSMCKEYLIEGPNNSHWIHMKDSFGKVVRHMEMRVCPTCYRGSK